MKSLGERERREEEVANNSNARRRWHDHVASHPPLCRHAGSMGPPAIV
jgi:hypothetical protein